MRTGQIQAIIYTKKSNNLMFLLLKRNIKKGGYWQPVTGGIENDETPEETLKREVFEELGIKKIEIKDFHYEFSFRLSNGQIFKEKVFAVKIDPETDIKLSKEHTSYEWLDYQQAIKNLKWDTNKKALTHYFKLLKEERC